MAYDTRLTLSNETKYIKVANSTTQTFKRLSDQLTYKLGTNRKSELQGKIGKPNIPYEKLMTDYILSL